MHSKLSVKRVLQSQQILTSCFICSLGLLGCFEESQSTFTTVELKSEKTEKQLFIKAENWGLTGDKQKTAISISKDATADSTKEYMFYGLSPFVYQQNGDSLILYTRQKVTAPSNWTSDWKVIQIEVDNPRMMHMWQKYKHI